MAQDDDEVQHEHHQCGAGDWPSVTSVASPFRSLVPSFRGASEDERERRNRKNVRGVEQQHRRVVLAPRHHAARIAEERERGRRQESLVRFALRELERFVEVLVQSTGPLHEDDIRDHRDHDGDRIFRHGARAARPLAPMRPHEGHADAGRRIHAEIVAQQHRHAPVQIASRSRPRRPGRRTYC